MARVVIPKPMQLDFAVVADGVKKNNMGLGGIQVSLNAAVDGASVKVAGSGQTFKLAGSAANGAAAWRILKVLDWANPKAPRVQILR